MSGKGGFVKFVYNEELEKGISNDDCNWNIQLYLYQFKHNPLVLRVGKGVRVWTQLTEDSKPIEWGLDDIDSLKELKEISNVHLSARM